MGILQFLGPGLGATHSANMTLINSGGASAAVNSPEQISGMQLWLKADAGVIKDGADKVSTWADQSGQTNHLTQTLSASQPTYEASGFNGLDSIYFDGSDDYLLGDNVATVFHGEDPAYTIFVAVQAVAPSGLQRLYSAGYSAGNVFDIMTASGSSDRWEWSRFDGSSSKTTVIFPNEIHLTDPQYLSFANAGTTADAYRNGLLERDNTDYDVNAVSMDRFTLGVLRRNVISAGTYFNGRVAELMIYNRNLSESELGQIHSYLSARYGI